MGSPEEFLDTLFAHLQHSGVDVRPLLLDHICHRTATRERYVELCADLAGIAELLGEQVINGRPISVFRLHDPWCFHDRMIDVVEVPAPKPGSPYPEGFEHAEFVVGDLKEFVSRHGTLPWDLEGMGKPHNAEARLRFGAISAKFHQRALADVITEELAAPKQDSR